MCNPDSRARTPSARDRTSSAKTGVRFRHEVFIFEISLVAMKNAIALIVAAACLLSAAPAKRKRSANPAFTYYLLSLSWAPDFCALPNVTKSDAECGKGRKVGFIVHGLWPQDNTGRGPQNCGAASPVGQDLVLIMLKYIPTAGLIQHEWATHGTCSGLSMSDYFAALRKARDGVAIPAEFQAPSQQVRLSPAQIEAKFRAANASFPAGAFHTSCTSGALQEVRICFNKDVSPRACPANLAECTSRSLLVRPVQ
jgi:ribonuclease T2